MVGGRGIGGYEGVMITVMVVVAVVACEADFW